MSGIELSALANVGIVGAGSYFAGTELDNVEVLRHVMIKHGTCGRHRSGDAEDAERLQFLAHGARETLGLERRFWVHEPGTPLAPEREYGVVDLGVGAARAALADAAVPVSEVSLVVVATSTPHRMTAAVATAIGARLGIRAACFDIRDGCAAGIMALITAAQLAVASGGIALVIGVDTFSKIIPPNHRLAALSLGDGAGAVVVGPHPSASVAAAYYCTDGGLGSFITTPGPLPPPQAAIAAGAYFLDGDSEGLEAALLDKYGEAMQRVLAGAELSAESIALFVPHQTTISLIGRR